MARVIGALVGLIAVCAYAFAALELLGGLTGIDVAGVLTARLPDDVAAWLAAAPIASGVDDPMWRSVVMGIALGAGVLGSLLLIVGGRLSAVLLWLAFLLLAGVLVGQDLVHARGLSTIEGPEMIALVGVLALALLFAAVANAATAPAAKTAERAPRWRPAVDRGPRTAPDVDEPRTARRTTPFDRSQPAAPPPRRRADDDLDAEAPPAPPARPAPPPVRAVPTPPSGEDAEAPPTPVDAAPELNEELTEDAAEEPAEEPAETEGAESEKV